MKIYVSQNVASSEHDRVPPEPSPTLFFLNVFIKALIRLRNPRDRAPPTILIHNGENNR